MRKIKAGATSQIIYLEVLDSTSTTGGRKTGLVFNTSSLTAYYALNGAAAVAITLATLAAANSAYSSGGFKEVDATNMPGIYRLDLPNAAVASGPSVVVVLKGATGMVQVSVEIQLEAIDAQDAVRAGLTALPNAAAEAAGGLYTRGTGAGQINQANNGQIDVNNVRLLGTAIATPATAGIQDVNVKNIANAAVDATAAQVGVNVVNWKGSAAPANTGDAFARLGAPAGASVSADVAAVKADTAAVKTQTDKLAFTVTNQVDANVIDWKGAAAPAMTGDAFARLGAPVGASISADIAGVQADTDNLQTRVPAALVSGRMDASVGAMANDVLTAAALATDAVAEIQSGLASSSSQVTINNNVLAVGTAVAGVQSDTDDIQSKIGTPAGASVSADVAAVKSDTAAIKAKTDNLPASPAAVGSAMTLTAAYDAAKTAAQAGDAMALTTAAQAAAADKLLGRSLAGGADGGRDVADALRILRNKRAVAAGTLTVYQEDDATPAWTATVATAASDPIDSIDPA